MRRREEWRGKARALLLAAAGVALVTVGAAAARQPAAPPPQSGMRGPMPLAHLNLTDEQRTRVQAILAAEREGNQQKFDELRSAHEELRAAIYASAAPDAARVDELVTRVANLEAEALRSRVATQIKIASILTDEQRQEAASAKRPRRGGRRGPGF